MTRVIIQPASNKDSRKHFVDTVEKNTNTYLDSYLYKLNDKVVNLSGSNNMHILDNYQ
jgi:hypothetical protein